jgi:hypothetical protein
MKKIALLTGCLLWAGIAWAQTVATGWVYEDTNRNGKKDRTEKGVAQVAVSNGVEVTLTDASGAYRLPVGNDNILFVIKPSGYQAPLDSFNLPQTYYIHKPSGSPALRYPGVAATGALPAAVNFALVRQDEPEQFTSFIFGDTQIYNDREAGYLLRGIVDEARRQVEGVSFGITLGDLVGDTLPLHPVYKQAIRQMGLPWYNVIGNHDMNYDIELDRHADETFEANFGPANYAFNYAKAHFIVLDDIIRPNPATGQGYIGGMRDEQFEFLRNDLAYVPKDALVVIAMHIPLRENGYADAYRDTDKQRFFHLLREYPNVLLLNAHTHTQYHNFYGKEQGVDRAKPIHEYNAGATCGDWYSGALNEKGLPTTTMRDGTPQNYAFLRVDGNRYVIDYKALGQPADYQMSVYQPRVVPSRGSSAFYVNFFMGHAGDRLECRVDGGTWRRMQYTETTDPAYVRYAQDWDFVDRLPEGHRPSNPAVCLHLWRGQIPSGLSAGEHQIEIRATDLFGRTHTATSRFLVVSS